jgi:hypothetical protein
MCWPFRHICRLLLALAALPTGATLAAVITAVPPGVLTVADDARTVRVAVPALPPPGVGLVLFDDRRPIGWYVARPGDTAVDRFVAVDPPATPSRRPRWRAWLVAPDVLTRLYAVWPPDLPLTATIDSLGPGARTAWLSAGAWQGITVGTSWWSSAAGQPLARFDVLLVADDVCFARVVPLVREPALRPGVLARRWPTPGEEREGRLTSAVCFVEPLDLGQRVWLAAAPHVPVPTDANVDFTRAGGHVQHGVIEDGDRHFWYVRTTPPGGVTSAATTQPASTPTTVPAADASRVRVGDRAVIRTPADVAAGRQPARVFELLDGHGLINAGERERLSPGDIGEVWRAGAAAGTATVHRVQRAYSLIVPGAPLELRIGDEVRFVPPPPPAPDVGRVHAVAGRSFVAEWTAGEPPTGQQAVPLQGDTTPTAVAVLLHVEGGWAWGVVPPGGDAGPIAPGLRLGSPVPLGD